MSLVVVEGVCKSYDRPVLTAVTFRLAPDSRAGLIGPNGEGKTTLLGILAGLVEPTEGTVQRRTDLQIGYLPQEPPAPPDATLYDSLMEVFQDVRRMERQLHVLAEELAGGTRASSSRYDRLQAEFESRGGYDYTRRIETVLTGLGFGRDLWRRPLARLSGGERSRGYLARLLLQQPELLLLDEPTNHLDMDAVEWLERYLQSFGGAIVVVSHDRYFLDRTTATTLEIASGRLHVYRGNYTAYLRQREHRHKEQLRRWQAQQEHVQSTEEFIRRHHAASRAKEAEGRRTRLERFLKTEAIAKPHEQRAIRLRFAAVRPSGDPVLRAGNLAAGHDASRPIVAAENLLVRRGDRIAIVGPNGCGKTTLLRTLLGQLPPLSGKLETGAHVRAGHMSQTQEELKPEETVLEAVLRAGVRPQRARDLLGGLLLSGEEAFKRIAALSGGQRSRVVLAQLIAREVNVLMLDEPSNHLDIPSQEVLQGVLQEFGGTILFVSHDRYLIDALAGHIWAIDSGTVRCLAGNWEDYLRWRAERPAPADATTSGPEAQAKVDRKAQHRLRRQETNRLQRMRRRLQEVEEEIHRLEASLRELNDQLTDAGSAGDIPRVADLGRRHEQVGIELKDLYGEWEKISVELEG